MAAALDVLIVEDHDALRDALAEVLGGAGHRVIAVGSAEAVAELPPAWCSDIAILDLNLPGEDGLSLAIRLRRAQPGIGIVMLTTRASLADKLAGYDSGADLYLPKPVAPAELLAAVAALSRRLAPPVPADAPRLDLQAGVLHTQRGPIALRAAEVTLLRALTLAPDHRLESGKLLEVLGKPVDDTGKRHLAVVFTRLREKLEMRGLPKPAIRAERGVGYRLTVDLIIV